MNGSPATKEEESQLRPTQVEDKTNKEDGSEEIGQESTRCGKIKTRLIGFYNGNEFLILVVLAILLARAYPPLGANYLQPQITATWVAVVFIFIMAGLSLKSEELTKAFQRIWFNSFLQMFNLGVVSGLAYGFSRLLIEIGILGKNLADGMVVCACLPLTVNMVLVLTKAAGGDEASAVFNAAFGNMLGVFLSPVLILGYLGVSGNVDLVTVFYKLALRVLLPVLIGQVLQKTSKIVVNFVKKYKKHFKRIQSYTLVFIVYTVFCRTFEDDSASDVGDIMIMIAFQGVLLVAVMVLAWYSLKSLFRDEPTLRVMGLFGCTHKTVALGVPLINAIYEDDPNVGLYTLPLLIWHPMQLVIGTFLAPRLFDFVKREKAGLGIVDPDDDDDDDNDNDNDDREAGDQEQPSLVTTQDAAGNGEKLVLTGKSTQEAEAKDEELEDGLFKSESR